MLSSKASNNFPTLAGLSRFRRLRRWSSLFAAALAASACCRLGADEVTGGQDASVPTDATASPTAPELPGAPAPASSALLPALDQAAPDGDSGAPEAGGREIAGASHILVAYKGAELAPKTVTRSKAEARKRAEEALEKLTSGKATFAELVQQYSDDPSKIAGGAIGNFERLAMPAAFSDATFSMPVGTTSGIVETPRGFHIIQRTR